ncbi:MAG: hypothetical protein A2857_06595 [Candidatus Levybacteria bacterium RIFCSPHIGHO2_01_FULL_36_15]|nr:MAG: hypothetical protein A2857_06595 [Candidatus Levybacteria bacterium RIFCSPHIGHO2_01_FULL_36_15]OGH38811.1 MAG: hypothetical protein A2905_02520 [Candidatus Levybacteria bacterium RIFCSPLOWO2_01_FULL_36_10]
MINNNKSKNGYIALISILIISTVTSAIALSLSLLGINEAKNSLGLKKGYETLKIAEGCAEEALYRLKNNQTYSGTIAPLNVGNGSCTITISGANPTYTILINAVLPEKPSYAKSLRLTVVAVGKDINITSWQEIQ